MLNGKKKVTFLYKTLLAYRAQIWPQRNNESHCTGSPLEHEKLMILAIQVNLTMQE